MDPRTARPPGHLGMRTQHSIVTMDMGAAGHHHVKTCNRCRIRDTDFECTCPEPCNWDECPVEGDRLGPLDYHRPAVPRFKPEEDK